MAHPVDKHDILKTKVTSLVARTTIQANLTDNVQQVFEKLVKNKIQSVPLYSNEKQKYLGFIDLADIIFFLLDNLKEDEVKNYVPNPEFLKKNCWEVKNKSKKNKFKPVQQDASLGVVLEILDVSLHRVPVINQGGEFVGILSQSALVQFIYNYIQLFDIKHTVGELKLGHCDVISIKDSDLALDGFRKIRDNGISAVAVVDSEGKLAGCLSLSDLRIVGSDFSCLRRVYLSVDEFLQNKDHSNTSHPSEKKRPEVLSVTNDSTVTQVADLFFKFGVHRVFVVDNDKKPIGVISLGNYLKIFRNH